jgi:hypothetical protein
VDPPRYSFPFGRGRIRGRSFVRRVESAALARLLRDPVAVFSVRVESVVRSNDSYGRALGLVDHRRRSLQHPRRRRHSESRSGSRKNSASQTSARMDPRNTVIAKPPRSSMGRASAQNGAD